MSPNKINRPINPIFRTVDETEKTTTKAPTAVYAGYKGTSLGQHHGQQQLFYPQLLAQKQPENHKITQC